MTQTRQRCGDEYPAHDPGGCPDCTPMTQAIVAECWTCQIHVPTNCTPYACSNPRHVFNLVRRGVAQANACRAAGHDIRYTTPQDK